MKKTLGITIVLFALFLMGISVMFYFDNKEYFTDYFNTKQKKLQLRSEESVDSLLNIIKNDSLVIDSLKGSNTILEFNLKNSIEANTYWKKSMKATIDNYENILKQNNIDNEENYKY